MNTREPILHQGDFLRLWQVIEDSSVDLILADPPYGCLKDAQPWDERPDFHVLAWIFSQLLSTTGQIAIFGDFKTALEIRAAFDRYFDYRFYWIWQKPSAIPANHTKPANDTELILVFKAKGCKVKDCTFNIDAIRTPGDPYHRKAGSNQNSNPTRKNGGNMPLDFENNDGGRYPRTVLNYPNKPAMKKSERTTHPTQKPLQLLEHIINALTHPDDMVLDPFLGSGSTLLAAHTLRRSGIGFELCPEYFEMANARLNERSNKGEWND